MISLFEQWGLIVLIYSSLIWNFTCFLSNTQLIWWNVSCRKTIFWGLESCWASGIFSSNFVFGGVLSHFTIVFLFSRGILICDQDFCPIFIYHFSFRKFIEYSWPSDLTSILVYCYAEWLCNSFRITAFRLFAFTQNLPRRNPQNNTMPKRRYCWSAAAC